MQGPHLWPSVALLTASLVYCMLRQEVGGGGRVPGGLAVSTRGRRGLPPAGPPPDGVLTVGTFP
jgi:hypothetical protein